MVINIGELKVRQRRRGRADIAAVAEAGPTPAAPTSRTSSSAACSPRRRRSARAVLTVEGGADFVKTSTAFHRRRHRRDVRLMRETVGPDFGVKAAGGIRTPPTPRLMIEAGANRLRLREHRHPE
ncbi:MAG: deoxyribose-phosphate aldolase [Collinsella sp.]